MTMKPYKKPRRGCHRVRGVVHFPPFEKQEFTQ